MGNPTGGGETLLRLAEHVEDLIYRYEYRPVRRFAYVSPASERIVGYTPEEHYQDPDLGRKYISDADLEALEALLKTGAISGPIEQQWRHRDGHVVWIEQKNVPILDGEGRLVAVEGISRDITLRKLAESERESLIAAIAHDLKNPLTAVLGLSRVMQRDGLGPDMIKQLADDILAAGNRMNALLGEILDVSKLEAGNALDLQKSECDLLALLHDVCGTDERVHLQTPASPIVLTVDEARISRVIHNLIDNGLKYSPEGTPVTVSVSEAGSRVEINVSDRGIGISKRDQANLFQRFYRGANAREKYTGTGLGLWGSRLIADAHGGDIEVISKEGEGTTFRLTLPCVSAQASQPAETPASP